MPFAGALVHELPPNGQGIATLMALGMMEELGLGDRPVDDPATLHLAIEAVKLAMADLGEHVADPDFMRHPPAAFLDRGYLARRAALIDRAAAGDPRHGAPAPGGTVYLAAADAQGMMVSYIQSNYMGFGSGVVVPGTGVSLQNRGAGFVLRPGHANAVGPRKRPFHTIIPGFATTADGRPLMAFGLMGGPMQAQGHVQLALRILGYGQNPQAASDAPRWRVLGGRQIAVEPGLGRRDPGRAGGPRPRDPDRAAREPLRLRRLAGDPEVAGRPRRRLRPAQGRPGGGLLNGAAFRAEVPAMGARLPLGIILLGPACRALRALRAGRSRRR